MEYLRSDCSKDEQRVENQTKYKDAINWLKANDYIVKVECNRVTVNYPIKEDIMWFISDIRSAMGKRGYKEVFLGPKMITIGGYDLEIVSFIEFESYNEMGDCVDSISYDISVVKNDKSPLNLRVV